MVRLSFVLILLVSSSGLAQEIVPDGAPSPLLMKFLLWLASFQAVGPYLATVTQWLGFFAVLLTAVSAFLLGVSRALEKVSNIERFKEPILKAKAFVDVLLPYIQYFSMFNVQKRRI